jgi:hypothetical protein
MDIYVDSSNRTVTLEVPVVPVSGSLNVTVHDAAGTLVHTVNTVSAGVGSLSFSFPFVLVSADASYTVRWSFNFLEDGEEYPLVREQHVNIVTPILPLSEIAKIIGSSGSSEDVADVEKSVRHIIQAHTGQAFGYAHKTLSVEGHGERALRLPERLVELEGLSTLTANLNPHTAIITSDGWFLKKGWSESVTAIASDNRYFGGDDITDSLPGEPGFEKAGHGYVISAPGSTKPSVWRDDYPFKITGWWGYRSVPSDVSEAARLLVNDYASNEALYRDRYLTAVKAADWRLDFNARTWEATGNVRADQLLAKYVLLNWAVV